MSRYKEILFKDFITLQRGFDLPKKNRIIGKYPIVASTSINGYHNKYKVKGPGVVTGRSGSLGEAIYISEDFWPLNTTLWVRDFKNNNPKFVYYLLKTMDLARYNSGVGVPTLNRNHLDNILIIIPERKYQKIIASTLSYFDALIEANSRCIGVLEELTQNLYNEWFVHLRFPGHKDTEIAQTEHGLTPKGWNWINLFDIAEVTFGKALKSKYFNEEVNGVPIVRIRDIPNNSTNTYTTEKAEEKYIIKNGDILVGMDGNFHMCRWAGGDAYLVQRVARFKPKKAVDYYFLFWALNKHIEYFNATIIGTTVAHLGKKHLEPVKILVPEEKIMQKTKEYFDPMYKEEINLRIKNEKLKTIRDLLLPKLISGEIDISDINIAV